MNINLSVSLLEDSKKIRSFKSFQKFALFTIFNLIIIFSCNKKSPVACGIENPQFNIEWLRIKLSNRFCTEVYTLVYKGVEYIIVCDCPTTIDGMIQFFDCQGNKICDWGGANPGGGTCNMPIDFTFDDYELNKKLIYKQP